MKNYINNVVNNVVTQASATTIIRRKIGNTVYRVAVSFSNTSQEQMEDKILRLIENDDVSKTNLKFGDKCGILSIPQTGLLLEGGSL